MTRRGSQLRGGRASAGGDSWRVIAADGPASRNRPVRFSGVAPRRPGQACDDAAPDAPRRFGGARPGGGRIPAAVAHGAARGRAENPGASGLFNSPLSGRAS